MKGSILSWKYLRGMKKGRFFVVYEKLKNHNFGLTCHLRGDVKGRAFFENAYFIDVSNLFHNSPHRLYRAMTILKKTLLIHIVQVALIQPLA